MSSLDPRSDLHQVLRLCNRCDLSQTVKLWVTTTLEAVEPIMCFVEYLAAKGYPIPDDVLKEAFKKVHSEARGWIAHDAEVEVYYRWRKENDPDFEG